MFKTGKHESTLEIFIIYLLPAIAAFYTEYWCYDYVFILRVLRNVFAVEFFFLTN